jgi:hypothetical protein
MTRFDLMTHPDRRWTFGIIALYAALGAASVGFASRRVPQRVDMGAVLIAGLLHLSLVLFVRRLDRRASLAMVLISLAFLAVTVVSGPRHDYEFDLQIWNMVRMGNDPWWRVINGVFPLNAYGPLFNVLALPAWVNPLAPKLLFAYAYLMLSVWLVRDLGPRRGLAGWPALGMIAWLFNPFVWVEIAIFGHFDILVGVACVAAVEARVRGRDLVSGSCLATGVLLKYIPIVLLPFLILDRGKVRLRLLASALAVIALGLGASCAIWGTSTFRPLTFAATRESSLLSILRFLRGSYSPLRWFMASSDLDAMATPFLIVTLLRAWTWCRLRWIDPVSSAVLAILTLLLFYQVGFPQYQMVLFVLATYWVVRDWERFRIRSPLAAALGCYFGWQAAFDVLYCWFGGTLGFGDELSWVPEVVGLPTFLLGCVLVVCVVREAVQRVEAQRGPVT